MVRAHPSWAAVYRRVLAEFGVRVDEAALGAALDQTFGEGAAQTEGPFEASAEASYQRLKAFDARVLAALGQPPQPDGFFRALEAAFALRSAWWVFEDVPPALVQLRDAGFRLGVISNWSWNGAELLHTLELAQHFEAAGHQRPGRLPEATRRHLRARPGSGRRRRRAGRACRGLGSRRCAGRAERRYPAGAHRTPHARARRSGRWRWRDGRQRRRARAAAAGPMMHRCRSSATSTACSTSSTCLAPSASRRPEPPAPRRPRARPMPPPEAPDWRLFIALPLPAVAAAAVGQALLPYAAAFPKARWLPAGVAPRHAAVPGRHADPMPSPPSSRASTASRAERTARGAAPLDVATARGAGRARGGDGVAWLTIGRGQDMARVRWHDVSPACCRSSRRWPRRWHGRCRNRT